MKRRVLIVDDQQNMLNTLQRGLREFCNEYEVFVTTKCDEVLDLIEANGIDLLITDILMLGKSGLQLAAEVRVNFPLVKIITTSVGGAMMDSVEYLDIARLLGSSHTLNKPFNTDELVSVIRQALN